MLAHVLMSPHADCRHSFPLTVRKGSIHDVIQASQPETAQPMQKLFMLVPVNTSGQTANLEPDNYLKSPSTTG